MAPKSKNVRSERRPLDATRKAAFLSGLSKGLSVTAACNAIELSRAALYKERERDEEFANQWDDAYEAGSDTLEDRVLRLGVEDKNLTALIFLLNGRRPEKFRQRHDMTTGGKTLHGFFGEAMALLEKGEAGAFKAGARGKS